jgi:hypothetical protein
MPATICDRCNRSGAGSLHLGKVYHMCCKHEVLREERDPLPTDAAPARRKPAKRRKS